MNAAPPRTGGVVSEPEGHDADDPDVRAEIADALRATNRFGPGYAIVRQAVSGSRLNFLVHADDRSSPHPAALWCRTTHRAIDATFGARFTLARETAIIDALAAHSVAVPRILGVSGSGRAVIQQLIDDDPDAPATTRAQHIAAYLAALDRVHDLSTTEILPRAEHDLGRTAVEAAVAEQVEWWTLADQLAADTAALDIIERATGLHHVGARLAAIHEHLVAAPVPALAARAELVHGDAGRANFLVDRDAKVWLIDWELAHAGSRLEDYAWIELRGLEQDEQVWRHKIMARLASLGPGTADAYRFFRTAIYFRSAIAISARIAAAPEHSFVPYLAQRFRENERLGWLSAGREVADADGLSHERLAAWARWTESLDRLTGVR